jgi:hypothetical protein
MPTIAAGCRSHDQVFEGYLILKPKSGFKAADYVQGQGADLVLKRSVHGVREHFNPDRNAAIGRKMRL